MFKLLSLFISLFFIVFHLKSEITNAFNIKAPMPSPLIITIDETQYIDLTQYFTGNNISFSIDSEEEISEKATNNSLYIDDENSNNIASTSCDITNLSIISQYQNLSNYILQLDQLNITDYEYNQNTHEIALFDNQNLVFYLGIVPIQTKNNNINASNDYKNSIQTKNKNDTSTAVNISFYTVDLKQVDSSLNCFSFISTIDSYIIDCIINNTETNLTYIQNVFILIDHINYTLTKVYNTNQTFIKLNSNRIILYNQVNNVIIRYIPYSIGNTNSSSLSSSIIEIFNNNDLNTNASMLSNINVSNMSFNIISVEISNTNLYAIDQSGIVYQFMINLPFPWQYNIIRTSLSSIILSGLYIGSNNTDYFYISNNEYIFLYVDSKLSNIFNVPSTQFAGIVENIYGNSEYTMILMSTSNSSYIFYYNNDDKNSTNIYYMLNFDINSTIYATSLSSINTHFIFENLKLSYIQINPTWLYIADLIEDCESTFNLLINESLSDESASYMVNLKVLDTNNMNIYQPDNNISNFLESTSYSLQFQIALSPWFIGPGLNYTVDVNPTGLQYNLTFTKLVNWTLDTPVQGEIIGMTYVTKGINSMFSIVYNSTVSDTPSLINCNINFDNFSQITNINCTDMGDIEDLNDGFAFTNLTKVIMNSDEYNIYMSMNTQEEQQNITFVMIEDNSIKVLQIGDTSSFCNDIYNQPSNFFNNPLFFCIQANQIVGYNYTQITTQNLSIKSPSFTINQNTLGILNKFNPDIISSHPYYPNYIFISNNSTNSIFILDISSLNINNQVNIINTIIPNNIVLPSFNFTVTNGYLLVFNQELSIIQEWDITNILNPYLRRTYNLFSQYNLGYSYDYSIASNLFYISAVSINTNTSAILIFTPGAMAYDYFTYVIQDLQMNFIDNPKDFSFATNSLYISMSSIDAYSFSQDIIAIFTGTNIIFYESFPETMLYFNNDLNTLQTIYPDGINFFNAFTLSSISVQSLLSNNTNITTNVNNLYITIGELPLNNSSSIDLSSATQIPFTSNCYVYAAGTVLDYEGPNFTEFLFTPPLALISNTSFMSVNTSSDLNIPQKIIITADGSQFYILINGNTMLLTDNQFNIVNKLVINDIVDNDDDYGTNTSKNSSTNIANSTSSNIACNTFYLQENNEFSIVNCTYLENNTNILVIIKLNSLISNYSIYVLQPSTYVKNIKIENKQAVILTNIDYQNGIYMFITQINQNELTQILSISCVNTVLINTNIIDFDYLQIMNSYILYLLDDNNTLYQLVINDANQINSVITRSISTKSPKVSLLLSSLLILTPELAFTQNLLQFINDDLPQLNTYFIHLQILDNYQLYDTTKETITTSQMQYELLLTTINYNSYSLSLSPSIPTSILKLANILVHPQNYINVGNIYKSSGGFYVQLKLQENDDKLYAFVYNVYISQSNPNRTIPESSLNLTLSSMESKSTKKIVLPSQSLISTNLNYTQPYARYLISSNFSASYNLTNLPDVSLICLNCSTFNASSNIYSNNVGQSSSFIYICYDTNTYNIIGISGSFQIISQISQMSSSKKYQIILSNDYSEQFLIFYSKFSFIDSPYFYITLVFLLLLLIFGGIFIYKKCLKKKKDFEESILINYRSKFMASCKSNSQISPIEEDKNENDL